LLLQCDKRWAYECAGSVVKERLIEEIARLPEDRLQEVLDFVGYLLSQEQKARATEPERGLDPTKDPLLRFIGGVSHGSLAKDIDKELYGG
jgi:hypothetical protein